QRAETDGCAADPAHDNVLAHEVDDFVVTHGLELLDGLAFGHLGDDRSAGLANRAALPFEVDACDAVVGADVDVERDDVAAVGVAATDHDVRVLDAAL